MESVKVAASVNCLSFFFFFHKKTNTSTATHFIKKHIHTMQSHPSSQISTERKTEPEHSSIDPGEKASSDAENDDDNEKSTKNLPDGGRGCMVECFREHI